MLGLEGGQRGAHHHPGLGVHQGAPRLPPEPLDLIQLYTPSLLVSLSWNVCLGTRRGGRGRKGTGVTDLCASWAGFSQLDDPNHYSAGWPPSSPIVMNTSGL